MDVSRMRFDPSLSHSQISKLPDLPDTNATFIPSGEYCGCASALVDAIKALEGPKVCRGVPSPVRSEENTTSFPSGVQARPKNTARSVLIWRGPLRPISGPARDMRRMVGAL